MDKEMVKKMGEKKLLIAGFLFMLCLHVATRAISDEELYLQGNSYYLQGDYNKALARYQEIKRKGPAVFHNMGNCHNYLSHTVDALISWRLAQRDAGYKEFDELERVIKQEKQSYYAQAQEAQENNKREDNRIDKNNFWAYAQRLFVPYSLLWLQIIFLFFWYLLFLLFYQKKSWGVSPSSYGRAKSWFTSLLYLCILGCMIFLGIALGVGMWLKNREQNYQRAVVAQDAAQLRSGPQNKFKKIADVRFLDELLVEKSSSSKDETQEKWYKVREAGWIEKSGEIEKSGGVEKSGWIKEASIKVY
jgi:ABC-type multidrug transport system fused ATPase/permease subunit